MIGHRSAGHSCIIIDRNQQADANILDDGVHHYDQSSSVQILELGVLSEDHKSKLTAAEKQNLKDQTPQPACEPGSSATSRIARCGGAVLPGAAMPYGIMNSA